MWSTLRRLPLRILSTALAVALLAPTPAVRAQTGQLVSIQGSVIYRVLTGDLGAEVDDGIGGEGQIRLTFSAFSIGAGVEYSAHDLIVGAGGDVDLFGGFVEPRYVFVLGQSAALYLSARLALSSVSTPGGDATGSTINGGGGLLFPLGSSLNLDVGATYGVTDWGELETEGGSFELGTGQNVVTRLGLAIGLGG